MNRVLSLGRPQTLTNKPWQLFLQQIGTPLLCHSAPRAGLTRRSAGLQYNPLSEPLLKPFRGRKAKSPDFTLTQASILQAASQGIDSDHRLVTDRGDFLNLWGKIIQGSFVRSLQLQAGNILAGSCPDCSCCLSHTNTHLYTSEGIT